MDKVLEGVDADVQLCNESGQVIERRIKSGNTEVIDALTTHYINFSQFAESLKMGHLDQLVAVNKDDNALLSSHIPMNDDSGVVAVASGGPLSEVMLAKEMVKSTVNAAKE